MLGWLGNVCNVLVCVGYIAFYLRLKDMEALVEDVDAPAVKKLTIGVLLYILALMLNAFPALVSGILFALAVVASSVFMLLGYIALMKSETFPGKDGMKLLFIAMIIGIVGGVLNIIPLIGSILGGICYIAEFVLVLLGWKKVATPITE